MATLNYSLFGLHTILVTDQWF